ncbi:MAG: deoxyribose-phosphate aldolase [Planctomycetota bacterium]|nr:MAG: deoxyribose-phosphate aldolase [Planctomycetota bacterium]
MSLVALIDHAVLQPTHGDADLRAACELCLKVRTASVCVKPSMVPHAVELLAGSKVLPSTVIGFPHGGTTTAAKVRETEIACRQGAREVDMVVNLGRVLDEDWQYVGDDIRAVVQAAHAEGAVTKVIFETGLLPSDALKVRLCELSEAAGAAFVKTSTGFGMVKTAAGGIVATGATEHDVQLMRAHCGPQVQVKASGGIRTFAEAKRYVALGATRLGTSATEAIAAGERGEAAAGAAAY